MKYHLALGRAIDLEAIDRDARTGKCPRHVMAALSQKLGAAVHKPEGYQALWGDKFRSKIVGAPEHWALASALSEELGSNDAVFCTGEDVGIPVTATCGAKRDRPKIAVFVHNIDRPRGWVAMQLFRLAERIDLFVTNARPQYEFLRDVLKLPENRLYMLPEQTDTQFFTPGPASLDKKRPTIASVGLEKRDYHLLAAATSDLDADVKISGFSKDRSASAKVFPKTLPENMSRRFYPWSELVQLYRDADVVALTLRDNKFCAGLTSMLEAMACRRPVVITQTKGLSDYLVPPGIASVVDSGNAAGLREAIVKLLNDPQKAQVQADRGYQQVLQHHNSEQYVEDLATRLASL